MKRLATAITLLIASSMAAAADPQVGEHKQSLVLASYNPVETVLTRAQADEVAKGLSDIQVRETLDVVSATLTYRLDNRLAEALPGMPK